MKYKFIFSLIILLIVSCKKNMVDLHPEIMKPIWTDVKSKNTKLNIGDIISIKTENNLLFGIVMDLNEDEMGIWYGICLSKTKIEKSKISNALFFRREIPTGFGQTCCIDCVDLSYLNEKGLNENIKTIDNINLLRCSTNCLSL